MTFTPEPWKIVADPDNEQEMGWGRIEVAPDRFVTVEGRSRDEAMANLVLCCAAPAMLSTLKLVNKDLERLHDEYLLNPSATREEMENVVLLISLYIDEAIAKAEGRV